MSNSISRRPALLLRSVSGLALALSVGTALLAASALPDASAAHAAGTGVIVNATPVSTDVADWTVDRAPAGFENVGAYEGRENVLRLSIDPAAHSDNEFRNHQGMKQNLEGMDLQAGNAFLRGDMWIPADDKWASGTEEDYVNTGIWASTMSAADNEITSFPILHFTNQGDVGHLRAWDPVEGEWIDLPDTAGLVKAGDWNRFDIRIHPESGTFEYLFNGESVWSRDMPEGLETDFSRFKEVFLQGYNNGVTAFDAHWSSLYAGLLAGQGDRIGDFDGSVMIAPLDGEPVSVSVADGASIGGSFIADGGEQGASADFEGSVDIGGDVAASNASLSFDKSGAGTASIGGNLDLAGGSSVSGNAAGAPGSIGGTVSIDGTSVMGGNWNVAGDVNSSGRIAPGNSIGTITVGHDLNLSGSSVYDVEIDAAGNADRIVVGGDANLAGHVEVSAIDGFKVATPYRILTATGDVNGGFDSLNWDKTDNYFLDAVLSYDDDGVNLSIDRNAIAFASVAGTANQASAAAALDAAGMGNKAAEAVARLSASAAPDAFDQLSGEVHGAVRTGLLEDSRHLRDAVHDRIATAFGSPDADAGFGMWGSAYGSWGHSDGTGNAARMDRGSSGFFTGFDAPLTDTVHLGFVTGYGNSRYDIDGRNSQARVDSYHLGAYAGGVYDQFVFSGGAAYSWNDIRTDRSVAFGSFADSLTGDYKSRTAQFFAEAGYRIPYNDYMFEPFANLAYVNLDTDGFREAGGDAALSGSDASNDATFTTLGLRASGSFELWGAGLNAHGMIGWRHAWTGTAPAHLAFAGGAPFTVHGVSMARNSAVIAAGFDMNLTDTATLGVSYDGQFGDVDTHGIRANLGLEF